ncbi:PREDICTED: topless-related protein 2-like [Camelina sativa]|uniref:Topless-related protein 2-like n=1 Tax=Camelina sativa TaxID=90675 RepID=A0ABM0ZCY9_CAMSA|nr:PREDICTED: topless-related protein 2-like [Camelina sativa]
MASEMMSEPRHYCSLRRRKWCLSVGCSSGEVTLWEVRSREKVVTEPFKIWNMEACCVNFQGSIVKDPSISVSRVSWSPDGNLIGVAFTKHLIHIYAYHGSELRQHLEPCLFPFL